MLISFNKFMCYPLLRERNRDKDQRPGVGKVNPIKTMTIYISFFFSL